MRSALRIALGVVSSSRLRARGLGGLLFSAAAASAHQLREAEPLLLLAVVGGLVLALLVVLLAAVVSLARIPGQPGRALLDGRHGREGHGLVRHVLVESRFEHG